MLWSRGRRRGVAALRRLLFDRQGGFCHYCGIQMRPVPKKVTGPLSKRTVTLEHLKPFSESGKTTTSNCVAACLSCNGRRGNMPLDQWDALLSAANEDRHGQAP